MIKKEIFKKNKKLIKILLIIVISIGTISIGYFLVQAQSVSDDFTTTDNIVATWQTTVATGAGEVTLELRDCDVGAGIWFCNNSTICTNDLGDGDYILVAQDDLETTMQWKTAQTACDQPECGINGGNNGDSLVADNTVDFSTHGYTARDACKDIGGRLPTKDELDCIYDHKATFGNNFAGNYYWSSTEYSAEKAWGQYFATGSQNGRNKTDSYYVRCVRGW